MSNCLRCGVLLKSTNPKAKYCGGVCRVMAGRERVAESVVGDGVEWLIGVDGLKRRMGKSLVLELMGRYGVVVPSVVVAEKIEPSAVVEDVSPKVVEVVMDKQQKLSEFRGVIADVMGGDVSRDTFVFPDGLDDVLVDYQKLYDECMFPDEYKALWERISADPNVSAKELPIWKLRLNAK